jgi:hypothetical protein
MREVSELAAGTIGAVSRVRDGATDVAQVSDELRQEVDEFLASMRNVDPAERRRWERIPGKGARASLHLADGRTLPVTILDIARGGVAMENPGLALPPGTEQHLTLPGSATQVAARVVRSDARTLVLCFRQTAESLQLIDLALDAVSGQRRAVA